MMICAKVMLKLDSEPKKFRSCQLIVFQEFLMVFDIIDHRDTGELFDFKLLVQGPTSDHSVVSSDLHLQSPDT